MAYKGFSPGLICLGKQYAENRVFKEMNVLPCESGLHYCENPLDVLSHYPLINADNRLNEFAVVQPRGKVHTVDGIKFCTGTLYVDKRLSLREYIEESFKFKTRDAPRRKWDKACISSSHYAAQLVSMSQCAHIATACNNAIIAAISDNAHLISCGDNSSILSVGDNCNLSSSGECVQIVSDGNNVQIAISGNYPKIYTLGNSVKINSNSDEAVIVTKGENAVIYATGINSMVKGRIGSIITLTEWTHSRRHNACIPVGTKTAIIDGKTLKENTFYTLRRGEFVEVGKEENDSR